MAKQGKLASFSGLPSCMLLNWRILAKQVKLWRSENRSGFKVGRIANTHKYTPKIEAVSRLVAQQIHTNTNTQKIHSENGSGFKVGHTHEDRRAWNECLSPTSMLLNWQSSFAKQVKLQPRPILREGETHSYLTPCP